MHRLVHHTNPEGRETPMLLLADLRQLDPTIELVYVGGRMWWAGRVQPNQERTRKGLLILEQMARLDDYLRDRPTIAQNIMLGHLLTEGFARIEMYRDCGDPSGVVECQWFDEKGKEQWYQTTILRDLSERFANFARDGGEAAVAARMRLTDGTARKDASDAEFREYLVNDGLDHYNREVRNRVTFGVGGMTGGSGRLISL